MDTRSRTVGFDRRLRLSWLDATADWAAEGLCAADIRTRLDHLLAGTVTGDGSHSARGKTMTVLLHIWTPVADTLVPLRDDGLALIRHRSGHARLPLHWGMCLATYPFFWDVAIIAGRLLSLQSTFTLAQVTTRMSEGWGARSTVVRATQRVLRSLVDWKVLGETAVRGTFAAGRTVPVTNDDGLCTWLLEATIIGNNRAAGSFTGLVRSPLFFPFELSIRAADLARSKRLDIHGQGVADDLVLPKQVTVPGTRSGDPQLRLI